MTMSGLPDGSLTPSGKSKDRTHWKTRRAYLGERTGSVKVMLVP